MKTCTKCGTPKPTSDYFIRDKQTMKLHAQCKACYKEHRQSYYSAHYKKFKTDYLARAKKRRDALRDEFRSKMIEYLSDKSCVICGENDMRVLEFDHIERPLKAFAISQGVRLGYKWDEIVAEINKCRILCANCHKKHTSTQFNWYKSVKYK